jgi:uncharacterized protein (TIRG00374 family)
VNTKLKAVLQYSFMLLLMSALLWLSLRSLKVGEGENKADFIWNAWGKSNKGYLLLMALFIMLSHLIRAERWKVLLVPTGNYIKLNASFLSVMVGYLINLVIPRGGELSRCYNLYKLENTPVEVSFGTVVVERIIDLICLMVIIIASFIVEWSKLQQFISTLNVSKSSGSLNYAFIIVGIIVFVVGAGAAFYFIRRNEKIKKLIIGFKEGLLAIFRLERKAIFTFYTLSIWMLYFLMSYCTIKAFPETSGLGFSAVVTLFAIGAIAMAAPLPGGAGSYHTLVPLGLVMLYQLPQSDAIAFVFIFHAWQTIVVIIIGLISLIASYALIRWRKPQIK